MLIPFRTRARTVDHLGREQIADCPTAISELWKNAYDAYARHVALHIFDGEAPIAAIVDDGHGMDLEEFQDKWLMLGTESKVCGIETPETDRNGLEPRVRQGKKGIGRLSVASLGPVCLVVSKRRGKPFVATMLDWRLFENPYLILEDVLIPVVEFDASDRVSEVVATLFEELVDNVWPRDPEAARSARLADAWRRWDEQSTTRDKPPSQSIAEAALGASPEQRHFDVFPALCGESECGTAIYVLDLNHELAVWVSPDAVEEDAEVIEMRNNLKLTLSAFVDPFSTDAPEFAYRVDVHRNELINTAVIEKERFTREEFVQLEHYLEGSFDQYGAFRGTVRAFAKEPFDFELSSQRIPPQTGTGYVGPFKLCIATFEQDPAKTTHSREQQELFTQRAERFAGLALYRAGLRVMPYGRPESDFFGMEVRRGKHAGREYWAHRRSFGRVAIGYEDNPNLHDKAGREGLIDNKARREMRLLVVGVLKETARRYFGTDAELRKKYVPEIVARNKAEKDARKAKKSAKREFRAALKKKQPELDSSLISVKDLRHEVKTAIAEEAISDEATYKINKLLDDATVVRSSLRLPKKPSKLGKTEAKYRVYRDAYEELSRVLAESRERWISWNEKYSSISPTTQARRAMGRHQDFLVRSIIAYEKEIGRLLKSEEGRLEKQATEDRRLYYARSAPILEALEKGHTPLTTAMRVLEQEQESIFEDVKSRYESYATALKQLSTGVDLSGAVVWSEEQREEIEQRMDQIYSLAQLGITVEIIGHELNELDTEIDRNLRLLPDEVQATAQFRTAFQAHSSLMDRLNFLAPLRMAGTRLREKIRGEEIHKYLYDFFRKRLAERRIRLDATEAFRRFSFVEFQYRVYPVFINLINNAAYWLTFVEDRRILLDRVDDLIVVADSGAGVDKDDIQHLFELFFTRKADGRGVGLYLCRANLHVGHHEINYIEDANQKILPGANFAIRFEGVQYE